MRATLIGALLAAVLFCPPLSPGSTQNERTETIAQNTQSNQRPPDNSARPVNPQASEENQSQGGPITPNSEERPVRVTSLPPVAVKADKDRWDKALVIFTGLIVIVGGFQIYFLFGTVEATKDNAIAARENAEAASASATATANSVEALINSERARIHAYLVECNQLSVRSYAFRIANHGKTAALISGYDVWYGCLQAGVFFSPERLEYSHTENFQTLLGSGETEDLERDIRMDVLFASCDLQTGAYYATVRYSDIVAGKQHETSFLYVFPPLTGETRRISTENRYT